MYVEDPPEPGQLTQVTDLDLTEKIFFDGWGTQPKIDNTGANEAGYFVAGITWAPPLENGIFWINRQYTATVNLQTVAGYRFYDLDEKGSFYHDEALEDKYKGVTYENRGERNAIVTITFPETGAFTKFSGVHDVPDSVIDLIDFMSDTEITTFNLNLGVDRIPERKEEVLAPDGRHNGSLVIAKPLNLTIDGGNYGDDARRLEIHLKKKFNASLITVGSGATLTLRNITFEGTDNGAPLITVADGGTLILGDGAVICGNTNDSEGGGVYVAGGGTLILRGGTISGNTVKNGKGGGVYVDQNGTFIMERGTICGNNGNSNSPGGGGGVHVAGTFIMEGGTICKNMATVFGGGGGGGVYIDAGGTFIMEGGTISGNQCKTEEGFAVVGAAVLVYVSSNFTKTGGVIYGIDADGEKANRIFTEGMKTPRPDGTLAPVPESVICVIKPLDGNEAINPYLYYNHTLNDTATGQVSYTGKGGSGEGTYSWGDTKHPWMGPLF
jgi:hypothetical protein